MNKRLNRNALWLLPLLVACATTPERSPENIGPDKPARWLAADAALPAVPDNWLAAFADPQLTHLVNTALADNFDLRAAAARVDAARALARIEGARRWPQLGFGAGYQRAQVRDAGFGSTEYGAFEALFDLSWELDVWGRLAAGQRSAAEDAAAAEADFHAARLSLAARTAQSYFDLAEARLQVAVAERSIHDRRTLAELVRGRFVRGLAQGLDLRLALTDLANAEAQLAQARNLAQLASRRLETLLGRYPAGEVLGLAQMPDPPAALA
ncbi:MAG: TolC family protein, partial [Candidatus Methylumidiphilus sp.]